MFKSTQTHYHPHLVRGDLDRQAALADAARLTADAIALIALANIELAPASTVVAGFALGVGFALDLGAASEGFLNVFGGYPVTGRFDLVTSWIWQALSLSRGWSQILEALQAI